MAGSAPLQWRSYTARSEEDAQLELRAPSLPSDAHTEVERVIVVAVADGAIVAEIKRGCFGDGRVGQKADDGAISLRRGAVDGEDVGRRPGKGAGDRLQAGDDDLALQLIVGIGVAGQRVDV